MLDVSRYRHDGSYASGRPSIYVVFGLQGFKRALEDLKNLWVRMAVQRNDHSRGHRAANKANFAPDFIWRGKEFNQRHVRSDPLPTIVTSLVIFRL